MAILLTDRISIGVLLTATANVVVAAGLLGLDCWSRYCGTPAELFWLPTLGITLAVPLAWLAILRHRLNAIRAALVTASLLVISPAFAVMIGQLYFIPFVKHLSMQLALVEWFYQVPMMGLFAVFAMPVMVGWPYWAMIAVIAAMAAAATKLIENRIVTDQRD